jgi:hypothetical protein
LRKDTKRHFSWFLRQMNVFFVRRMHSEGQPKGNPGSLRAIRAKRNKSLILAWFPGRRGAKGGLKTAFFRPLLAFSTFS